MTSFKIWAAALLSLILCSTPAYSQNSAGLYITEGYYRIKWGHFDEFMALFKKNHFPILKKMQELGHIEYMTASFPLHHASEESRWDFRMTIAIKDTAAFAKAMPKVKAELYPDLAQLKKDENYRMSLLLAHTDIIIREADLSSW